MLHTLNANYKPASSRFYLLCPSIHLTIAENFIHKKILQEELSTHFLLHTFTLYSVFFSQSILKDDHI